MLLAAKKIQQKMFPGLYIQWTRPCYDYYKVHMRDYREYMFSVLLLRQQLYDH